MRPPSIEDDELLERLLGVFRQHGYEGTSLSLISKATGLKRASLYHRFPGGKAQIAEAVMAYVGGLVQANVIAPLSGEGAPADRVRQAAGNLDAFYAHGQASCLLDTMSLGVDASPLREHVAQTVSALLTAFRSVAVDAGLSKGRARKQAELAVVRIQGSLVLARTTGLTAPFRDTLEALPDILTSN